MRLIDADALKEDVEFQQKNMWPEDLSRRIPGMIDNAPTIAAIPVEWMVSWINRHPNDLRCAWFVSLEMEWRKEQEVR